jgi:gliding motility-associated-like protein
MKAMQLLRGGLLAVLLYFLLAIPASAQVTISLNAVAGNCSANGQVIVNTTGTTGGVLYAIKKTTDLVYSPQQASNTFLNLVTASYTVAVYDANGTTISSPVVLTNQAYTPISISNITPGNSVVTACDDDASISVTATGGRPPYIYHLKDGPTGKSDINTNGTGNFTQLSTGTYNVDVTDACGNTITAQNISVSSKYNISSFDLGSMELGGGTLSSSGCNMIVNLPPANLLLKDVGGVVIFQRNVKTMPGVYPIEIRIEYPSGSGIYTDWGPITTFAFPAYLPTNNKYRIQLRHPCNNADIVTSPEYTISYPYVSISGYCAPSIIRNINNYNCGAVSIRIAHTTSAAERTYTWNDNNPSYPLNLTGLPGGTYNVYITTNGVTYQTANITTTTNSSINTAFIYNYPTNLGCDFFTGGIRSYNIASDNTVPITYSIISGPVTRDPVTSTKDTTLWNDLPSGTYVVRFNLGNCSSFDRTFVLTNPFGGFNADELSYVPGSSCGKYKITGKGWYLAPDNSISPRTDLYTVKIINTSNKTDNISVANNTGFTIPYEVGPGTYQVGFVNSLHSQGTCFYLYRTITIPPYQPLAVDVANSGGVACGNGIGELHIATTGGSGSAVTYRMKLKGAPDANYTPFQSSPDFPNVAAGNYTTQVQDACGYTSTQDVTLVAATTLSAIVITGADTSGRNASACEGSNISFNLHIIGNYSNVVWQRPNGTQASGNSFAINNFSAADIGKYYVSYSSGGCTRLDSVNVLLKPRASLTSTLTPGVICSGTVFNYAATTNTAGATYVWTRNAIAGIINGAATGTGTINETLVNINLSTTVNALYNFTITAPNGCTNTQTVTVPVKPTAEPFDISVANPSICINTTAVLTASSTVSGAIYNWYNNAALTGGPIFTGASFTTPSLSTATTYYVTLQRSDICENVAGNAKPATVSIYPVPVVNTVSNQVSCADNLGSNQSQPIIFSGNVNGAVFNWSMDRNIGYTQTGSGNIPSFTYNLPLNTAALTSTVTVTPVANGCTGTTLTFTYTLNPYPVTSATVNNNFQCLAGNSFGFTNTTTIPGGGNISYQWDFYEFPMPGATRDTTHTFSTAGNHVYVLTATSDKGCSRSFNGTVKVVSQPTASFTYSIVSPNTNDQYAFSNTSTSPSGVAGMSYYWDFGDGTTSTTENPSHVFTVAGTYTVRLTVTNANGCSESITEIITVRKDPNIVAGFTINNPAQCFTANSFVFTNTTSIAGGATVASYLWDFGDGTNSNAASPSHNYAGAGSYTVTLTVTASNGFTDVVTQSVNVFVVPDVLQPTSQVVCNNARSAPVFFASSAGNPLYAWSNNTPSIGLAASGAGSIDAFTAINNGSAAVTATITVTPVQNGCSGNPKSFTIIVNPTPNVSGYTSQTVCAGTTVAAEVFTGNVAGTVFSWTDDNASIGLAVTGTGSITSFTATNTTNAAQTANIRVIPTAQGCTGATVNFAITVNAIPQITGDKNAAPICSGSPFGYTPNSSIPGTSFTWTRLAVTGIAEAVSSGTGGVNEILTNVTNQPLIASYDFILSSPAGCTHRDTINVRVNPLPVIVPPVAINACRNTTVTPAAFSSSITGSAYLWSNSAPEIGLAASGLGDLPSFTALNNTNAPVVATISIIAVGNYVAVARSQPGSTPVLGCASATQRFTITVNPVATISKPTDTTLCPGGVVVLPAFIGNNVAGTSYAWTVDGDIGLPLSGTGNLPAFTAKNTTGVPKTVTVTITPSINGCPGTNTSFKITVGPTIMPDFSINNPVQCLTGNAFVFTGQTMPGVTLSYQWEFGDDSTGIAQTSSHTYLNPGTYTVRLTEWVEGYNCYTVSTTKTVTVNVMPGVGFTYSVLNPPGNDAYQFTSQGTITEGSITGYAWDFGDGGTSSVQHPQHTYTSGGNFTITYTATSDKGCSASLQQILPVNKNVNLTASFTINTAVQCFSGNNFVLTNTSTASGMTITSYAWDFGDGTTSNLESPAHAYATAGVYVIKLTVTTNTGETDVITQSVLVFPALNIVQPADMLVCAGTATPAINFKGGINSTSYNWTNDHPEIGLAASGSGHIASFNAINNNSTAVNAMITVIPVTNGCAGNPQSFSITVSPYPSMALVPDQTVCHGQLLGGISFTGNAAGTVFQWQNSNTTVGLAASGSGDIGAFTAVNTGYTPVTTTVSVIPYANGCTGATSRFTIRVNPIPDLTSSMTPNPVCDSSVFSYVPTGHVAGTVFTWSRDAVAGIVNSALNGTGNPNEFLDNVTALPVNVVYHYTMRANNCSATTDVNLTVNPRPKLSSNTVPVNVCTNTVFNYTPTSSTPGTVFEWVREAVPGISNAPALGKDNPAETLVNTTTNTVRVVYGYTLGAAGCVNTYNLLVLVNPVPTLTSSKLPTAVCSGVPFSYLPGSSVTGSSFAWTRPAVSGISNAASAGTGSIQETLINTTAAAITIPYSWTVSYRNCASTQTIDLVVNPAPSVSNTLSNLLVCAGQTVDSVVLTGPVAGTVYNWTNSNTDIGLVGEGARVIPSFTARNPYPESITSVINIVKPITPQGCMLLTPISYSIAVNADPSPVISAPLGATICTGTTIPLIASGGTTYQWFKDGNSIAGATSPQLVVTTGGVYSVVATAGPGCPPKQAASMAVTEIKKPKVEFVLSGYCKDTAILFTSTSDISSSGSVNYVWTDNAGHTSTQASPSFSYTQVATYSMKLKLTPSFCPQLPDSITHTFTIETPQAGQRLPVVNAVANSATALHARNIGNSSYQWIPATGLNNPTIQDPVATVSASQEYQVRMRMASGCVTTDTLLVKILGTDLVFIPNAISPNGDGKNDKFVIIGLQNYPGTELIIFNRWQNEVYHSRDYRNDWAGQGLNTGTYYYLLRLRTTSGIKPYSGWIELVR